MFRAVSFQILFTIVTAIIAGLVVGINGAVSAAAGGAACAFPNLLFALRLASTSRRLGASYPLNFFLGELAKVIMTVVLLVMTVKCYAGLHWPSMLVGMVLALQASFLSFWRKS